MYYTFVLKYYRCNTKIALITSTQQHHLGPLYLSFPTSNHNYLPAFSSRLKLYISLFLHQTTTQHGCGRDALCVQKVQISRIENGKNLTFATVLKLCKAMNVSVKQE